MILYAHALHHICIFTIFHAFRCVFYMLETCVLVGLDYAEPMMFLLLHVTCSCIFHAYIPFFYFFMVLLFIGAFRPLSLSLLFFRIVYTWHPSTNPLCPGTLFVPRHLLLLILLLFTFGSVMRRLVKTSWRTSLDVAFIQNAKSLFLNSPILTYPLSLIIGVGNPFVRSQSAVPL